METVNTLDIFCHWAPPDYGAAALKAAGRPLRMLERALAMPVMTDLDERLRLMDRFPGYRQVPCLVSPPLEALAGPEAMLTEARRAVTELGACGVQIFTNLNGAAIDTPPFMDLFALLADLDRPLLLHPTLGMDTPDYAGETRSKYELWWALGWPYETSKAMYRLVFAGIFDRWPDLKIITHHGGGLIPMIEGRLGAGLESYGTRTPPELREKANTPLRTEPLAAFKRFYTDTATFGSAAAVECSLRFFGLEHVLFATDMPFGPKQGAAHIRDTIANFSALPLNAVEREAGLHRNAERLLRWRK